MNPRLRDPATCLHELRYKSALYIIFAMLMPDAPRPCKTRWLAERTSFSRPHCREAARHLRGLGLVHHFQRHGEDYWLLQTETLAQLPLPIQTLSAGSLQLIDSTGSSQSPTGPLQLPLGVNVSAGPTDGASYPQVEKITPTSDKGGGKFNHHPPPSVENLTTAVENLTTTPSDKFSSHSTTLENLPPTLSRDHDHDDDEVNNINLVNPSSSFMKGVENLTTTTYLEAIGMNPPAPDLFGDRPLWMAMGHYWHTRLNPDAWHNPLGYVNKRLAQRHRPTLALTNLAQIWLAMDADDRQELGICVTGFDGGLMAFRPAKKGIEVRQRLGEAFHPKLTIFALDMAIQLQKELWKNV